MKKKCTILSVFLCLLLLAGTVFAAQQPTQKKTEGQALPAALVNVDESAKISQEKQQELAKRFEAILQKYDVNVGLYITANAPQGLSAENAGRAILSTPFFQTGKKGGIVLVVYTKSRDYYIATERNLNKIIPSNPSNEGGLTYVKKEMLPKLKDSNYEEAAMAYANTVEEELAYYAEKGEPFDPKAAFSFLAALIAIGVSALTFVGVRYFLISQMSNVAFVPEADEYLDRDSFELTEENDTFLFTNVVSEEKSQSDANESSSSDDSGSSGGSGGKF